MGLFKWAMKIGTGSIGNTVKVLAVSYNNFVEGNVLSKKEGVFRIMFNERLVLNRHFNQAGDMFKYLEFENFYELLDTRRQPQFDSYNDLPVFIFFIMFYESEEFRNGLYKNDVDARKQVYEVIHETCIKYASAGVNSRMDLFTNYVETLWPRN